MNILNIDNIKQRGIYRIYNTINNKSYVGSTWKSFNSRLIQHISKLKLNKHHCPHLQAAWNKYGEELFCFEILEIVVVKEELLNRESFYIDKFDCIHNGYNANPNPNFSPMLNQSSCEKSSKTHKKIWGDLENSMTPEEFIKYKQKYAEHRGYFKGKEPWNKGKQMTEEQTVNMHKPKVNGVSKAMKDVHIRNGQLKKDVSDYIIVYDKDMNWLNTFWCNSDLVAFSKSDYNNLPMKVKKGGTRFLDPSKIANHIKDGKAYKGLYLRRAPKSWKLSYANAGNSWKAESEPIMSQADSTLSEGAETTGEVKSS